MACEAYEEWISAYRARTGPLLGKCREAVIEMRVAFSQLTEVRGHVWCMWGKRGHAWLVTADGVIVDPTVAQFPGPVQYEPWKPGDEVRVGKCMSCGDDIWRPVTTLDKEPPRESACSPDCEAALMREYA